jgi:hypothetical protein
LTDTRVSPVTVFWTRVVVTTRSCSELIAVATADSTRSVAESTPVTLTFAFVSRGTGPEVADQRR